MSFSGCASRLSASIVLFLLAPTISFAAIYNAGADLKANMAGIPANPYGAWSYGSATNTLGAGFAPLLLSGVAPGTNPLIQGWFNAGGLPTVLVNTDTNPQALCCGITAQQPNEILMHAFSATSLADLRFTAPFFGNYDVSAFMERLHSNEGDLHVVVNGVSFHDVNLDGTPQTDNFLGTFVLNPGDTIDITVGLGAGGSLGANSIGLDLLITANLIPEPSTFSLLGLGGIGLAFKARRRRAAT